MLINRPGRAIQDKGARLAKVVRMIRILDRAIPTDEPTAIIPVRSLRGFHGVKVQGTTQGVPWSVTLYGGTFYLVNVSGTEPVTLQTPLFVINHLRAQLRRNT